jgi:H+/Cl- antiporter ClcA
VKGIEKEPAIFKHLSNRFPTLPSFSMAGLSLATGVLAGLSATALLYLLELTTHARQHQPLLLLTLPLSGLLIGLAYHYLGGRAREGANLILDEIHDPREVLPWRMVPLVLGGTLLTHLSGGSAGREGTAVQMGASLADQLGRRWKLSAAERRSLLMAGMGAGFGGAIGAPLAGVVFGLEVIEVGRIRFAGLAECALASAACFAVTHLLRAPHSLYPNLGAVPWEWPLPFLAAGFGILCGLAARLFVAAEHAISWLCARVLPFAPLRPLAGGALLAALFWWEGSGRYCGLGIEEIQNALQLPASLTDPFLKFGFTALTLGSGFKGGEFIPLVFIGTTLGSALGSILGLSVTLFGALGFAALFGAAASTPLACALMGAEIFGWHAIPYLLLSCYAGSLVSGHPGIYAQQPIRGGKLFMRGNR